MFTNKPNRLPGFDYSKENHYFITSVVKDRIPCFGEIVNGEMVLNNHGEIVLTQLKWLSKQYPYVKIHEHVVMPDHVHAIIEIDSKKLHIQSKIKSLSELVGVFKTTSSKNIRLNGLSDFQWQTSFHDRIVRDQSELDRISTYIQNNPRN
jgi:REP element-mobilizing transposase RayT